MRVLLLPRDTGFEFGISAATQTAEFHFPNFVSALLSAALAMNPPNFFAELKRRNVIRVAGLYLVGAWLLTQVASTVLPTFDVPSWALRGLIITLALGFVPALVFSWVFELTPQGLKRDAEVAPEHSIAPQTARRMNRMIIVVLIAVRLEDGPLHAIVEEFNDPIAVKIEIDSSKPLPRSPVAWDDS